jgi:hypothetical protein
MPKQQRLGTFTKGHKKRGGRKKGTPNRVNKDLLQAIVQAAEQVGSDGKGKGGVAGYMHRLADEKTGHFIPLLRQAVQKQAPAAKQPATAVVYRSEDEFRRALVERGVHSTLLPAPARDPLERPPTDLKPPQPPPGWQWMLRRSDETAEPDTNEIVTVETDQDAETAEDER